MGVFLYCYNNIGLIISDWKDGNKIMTKEERVDLHMHSSASDGIYSPTELMGIAEKAGLSAIGLTDHDTVKGLEEASRAAESKKLELVPGVEISVLEGKQEIHILGYYPDDRERLNEELQDIREERYSRMDEIVTKLKKMGFKVKLDEVLSEAGDSAPGRLHLARLLLRKKYIHTLEEAFSLYLNPDRGAYVPRRLMTMERAMGLLTAAGAIKVLAHPGWLGGEVVERLVSMGLQGLEVYHPDHSAVQQKYFHELALEKGLIITGGSDFHGDRERRAGYPEHLAIAGYYLDDLKKAALG